MGYEERVSLVAPPWPNLTRVSILAQLVMALPDEFPGKSTACSGTGTLWHLCSALEPPWIVSRKSAVDLGDLLV